MKNKVDFSLLMNMLPALLGVSRVYEYGKEKHGGRTQIQFARENGDIPWSQTLAAAERHLFKWFMGQTHDPESGEAHLDHAISRLIWLSTMEKLGLGKNDIYPGRFTTADLENFLAHLERGRDK